MSKKFSISECIYIKASYELQLSFLYAMVLRYFLLEYALLEIAFFYSLDIRSLKYILTWEHKSGKIWFNRNIESRNFSKQLRFETVALGLHLKNVGLPCYFIIPEPYVLQSKYLRRLTFLHAKIFRKCFNLRWWHEFEGNFTADFLRCSLAKKLFGVKITLCCS